MMMPVRELAQLTWEEVRDLDRAETIAILPVGAVEAHGPHLPLDTDVVIANAMARAGAERLADRSRSAVLLPPLYYTAAGFANAFAGTIGASRATITALVVDIARSLSQQGFAMLAIANSHLDPEHLSALDDAVQQCKAEESVRVVFPNLTRKPWASRLSDEFKSGACHAGQFESSIVLAETPGLVRESLRRTLEPNPQSLSQAIRDGKRTFAEAGGPRAYFGDPAAASAKEGRATIATLGEILADAVMAELGAGR
jgi:creatinine amidohydrolase